jgi:hypothetical protein
MIAKKKLITKTPISNPSHSRNARPVRGNNTSIKGVTKQCIAHTADVHIPSLSTFNFVKDFKNSKM